MDSQPNRSIRFAFGPYEVWKDAPVLRKSGIRVRLSGQPVQILIYLLENAGEIVTRQCLREHVWGEGTYVDFEHGIDVAVNKLRRVLSDSPEEPRYIQTVAGQGYRFIEPVQRLDLNKSSDLVAPVLPEAKLAIAGPEITLSQPGRWRPWLIRTALSIAVVLALWMLQKQYAARSRSASTSRLPVVLGEWANSTGDSTITQTLRQALATQLASSSKLGPLTEGQIRNTLQLMRKVPDSRLTPPLVQEVCERAGGAAVIEGWAARIGSQFLLGVRARSCVKDEIFYEDEKQVGHPEDGAAALAALMPRLEERLTKLPRPAPLPELTTKSLDALKAFAAGTRALDDGGAPMAMTLFERAVELDPEFAFAHSHLGRVYSDLGEPLRAVENITLAYRLRQVVSGPESFFITYNYRREVLRNLELARQTCEAWIRSYPNDHFPYSFLSGLTSQGTGQFERAVVEGRRALRINSHLAFPTLNILTANMALGRLPEARAVSNEAAAKGMNLVEFSLYRYFLSFLTEDENGMAHETRSRQSITDAQGFFEHQEAFTLAYHGRLREAQSLERQAIQIAQQTRLHERAATFEGGWAVAQALYGLSAQAKLSSEAALKIARGRDTDFGPAFAFALSRDKRAERMVADLTRLYPEDTWVQFQYLPTLRALIALGHGDAGAAVELSQIPANYEVAFSGTSACFFGSMYPVYVGGLAELQLHHYDTAALHFRKILAHPGLMLNDPVGALTRLQLARALAGSGNQPKARSAYLDFFSLWKNADPDLPILREARTEFKRL